jgi:HEPN domain-containing protein
MKRKLPTFTLKYVLISNGEEYPREWSIKAPTSELATDELVSTMVGNCDYRIISCTRDFSSDL